MLFLVYSAHFSNALSEAQLKEGDLKVFGYIDSDPQIDEFNTKVTMRMDDSHERVRLTLPHRPQFFYGDRLVIEGALEYPQGFDTDTGRFFDYQDFLRQENIFYVMKYPVVELQEGRGGSDILYFLFRFKHLLLNRLYKTLPEPHSSLMAGLILGVKSSLGPELLRSFTVTGVIHIVVLSGFNVTIIADFIARIFRRSGVRTSTVLSIASIIAFAAMTGATPPVVRASIMAILVIFARVFGYQAEAIRGLLFVACCMVLHNPLILLYNPSFQLSFLASLGLIVLAPWLEKALWFIPKTIFDLRGLAAASLSTQVFVFPLLIFMTGEVSLIAPLANIIVLWVVPITMFFGGVLLLGMLLPQAIVYLVIIIAWSLLSYILFVVTLLSAIPYASLTVPSISILTVGLLYILYAVIWHAARQK